MLKKYYDKYPASSFKDLRTFKRWEGQALLNFTLYIFNSRCLSLYLNTLTTVKRTLEWKKTTFTLVLLNTSLYRPKVERHHHVFIHVKISNDAMKGGLHDVSGVNAVRTNWFEKGTCSCESQASQPVNGSQINIKLISEKSDLCINCFSLSGLQNSMLDISD